VYEYLLEGLIKKDILNLICYTIFTRFCNKTLLKSLTMLRVKAISYRNSGQHIRQAEYP